MHKELKVPHDPAIPFLHAYPREMETHFTQKPVMNVYKYFIHNHPKLETTIFLPKNKHFSSKNEGNKKCRHNYLMEWCPAMTRRIQLLRCDNLDEPQRHNAEQRKSIPNNDLLYDSTDVSKRQNCSPYNM
jgi:hypothetical protein